MNPTNTLTIEQYLEDIVDYSQQVNEVILLALQNNVLPVVEKY